jgi:hypothetical protein
MLKPSKVPILARTNYPTVTENPKTSCESPFKRQLQWESLKGGYQMAEPGESGGELLLDLVGAVGARHVHNQPEQRLC